MSNGIFVGLSSQIATERRLATIAENIANANTVGYRQIGIRFTEVLKERGDQSTSFVAAGQTLLNDEQGPVEMTGNPLDFAISGAGWFSVQTPSGQAMTRDGRFRITADGSLVNLEGFPVLDQGGAPIEFNPAAGPVQADAAGVLHQGATPVGSIGVFDMDAANEIDRIGALVALPNGAVTSAVDRADYSVIQGGVEQSNVNAVEQLTQLISIQRNFESVSNLVTSAEGGVQEAIRLLGGK